MLIQSPQELQIENDQRKAVATEIAAFFNLEEAKFITAVLVINEATPGLNGPDKKRETIGVIHTPRLRDRLFVDGDERAIPEVRGIIDGLFPQLSLRRGEIFLISYQSLDTYPKRNIQTANTIVQIVGNTSGQKALRIIDIRTKGDQSTQNRVFSYNYSASLERCGVEITINEIMIDVMKDDIFDSGLSVVGCDSNLRTHRHTVISGIYTPGVDVNEQSSEQVLYFVKERVIPKLSFVTFPSR